MSSPEPPPPPPTPPAPPPVLEQEAPKTAAPSTSTQRTAATMGTKKYRNPIGIPDTGGQVGNSGLGISQ